MSHHARPRLAETSCAVRRVVCTIMLVGATFTLPQTLRAQTHEHAAESPTRDARLDLLLGGPHLILYHRGYLALGDEQVTGLQRLRRVVCDAEVVYVEQAERWRVRLVDQLGDSAPLAPRQSSSATPPSRLLETMTALASAESQWLTVLMHARRDALALLTSSQRTQLSALRDHWARESVAMIEEATRPGQRGHPGTQIPIKVPGMVVSTTTLLPHCEALHGPSRHISIPPPG